MNSNISTLGELLEAAGTQWRAYDIGRRITKLDKAEFTQIELGARPYPYPLMGHAHIAIQFWDKNATQDPYVWFLKFPIDEQSKLVLATRDHFANLVLEALGTELTSEDADGKLDNNPYVFTPNANKLAAFNALMKVEIKRPASQYYEAVENYFHAPLIHDWQTLAVQGLADFAMRLEHGQNQALLQSHWQVLPGEVQNTLAAMLEHVAISVSITELLSKSIDDALENQNKAMLINSLRAISGSSSKGILEKCVDNVLDSVFATDIEILLILVGRLWQTFILPERLYALLDNAAQVSEGDFFAGVFADLVAIPALRPQVLSILRAPSRDETLSRAIGKLFNA
ncbi:DUF3549 family protein [Pseudoalteromonas xiamenensis]|uniref:DUF3549 family protein n=1 Tax=Pseudoalteromonas xiamenensis TaxID=882626 RepID=A0A975DJE1_9GAMM|nr:DUF3549 family protein [Pseudoalteromonas xiamenensis]QTH71391.1 DUF3549 family protein [Pseudoalteromonas xiamenensis]